jgi:glycine/D-amino acid oxidase-like deaminating enzyme
LEQESLPGVHSSGRNAALVRCHIEDPLIAEMADAGADLFASGELAEFHQTGSILIGLGDENVADRVPLATGRGLWCPKDGVVDVAGLLSRYLAEQDVRYDTKVIGWHDAPDDAESSPYLPDVRPPLRVRTSRGNLTARVLINAAGPWAGMLGDLPLTPTNRHLFITPPMNTVHPDWPFVWDVPNGLYFRPESGGLLLCACDETLADPGRYDEDPEVVTRLDELVRTLQPGLGELHIMRTWVGQRIFAPDRRFVIGHDPRDPRIFHVAALGGHGITTAPAIGTLAASLLLRPGQPCDNPFTPARLF